MIAQWDSSLLALPVARVQFPAMAEYFKRFFLFDRTLPTYPQPAWQKLDFSLAVHMCFVHSSGSTKEWSGTKKPKKSPNSTRNTRIYLRNHK